MQIEEKQYDVGVIVGRFQVPQLHEAHIDLIESVVERHDKVVVFLGVSPLWSTYNNPLDFEARKQMLLERFPDINVLYIKDVWDDALWSGNLDRMIHDLKTPTQTVVLYGSRDSFIPHYTGVFPTRVLEPTAIISGTAARKAIARASTKASADFRAGAIWAASARFPTAFTTVDVAILSQDGQRVLLGRKATEHEYRFIGGFSDPDSETFELDVRREAKEEANAGLHGITYIGSRRQDDWRYRGERDAIKTLMFVARISTHSRPEPGDDIEEVRWFDVYSLRDTDMVESHRPLLRMLIDHLTKTARR